MGGMGRVPNRLPFDFMENSSIGILSHEEIIKKKSEVEFRQATLAAKNNR